MTNCNCHCTVSESALHCTVVIQIRFWPPHPSYVVTLPCADRMYLRWVSEICCHTAPLWAWLQPPSSPPPSNFDHLTLIKLLLYLVLTGCIYGECRKSAATLHCGDQDHIRSWAGRRRRPHQFPCARLRSSMDAEDGVGLRNSVDGGDRKGATRGRSVGPSSRGNAIWHPQHHKSNSPTPH